MLRERIVPQSEVIRAILLEDSPCFSRRSLSIGTQSSRRCAANPARSSRPAALRARPPSLSILIDVLLYGRREGVRQQVSSAAHGRGCRSSPRRT